MTQAYPLQWPLDWPRNSYQKEGYEFKRTVQGEHYKRRESWTFAAARDAMMNELQRLGAQDIIISSNFKLNSYGEPSKNGKTPSDQAIAVYFQLRKRPMVMASDRYSKAENNMRSITLAIEAMRQLERHGGGFMMERAFTGFAALPSPEQKRHWSIVLGVSADASGDEIDRAYKALAAEWHPDKVGPNGAGIMADINVARDQALQERNI